MEREANAKTTAANLAGQCEQLAKREKTWEECGIEEKVERMRIEMLDRRHFIDAALVMGRKAWELVRRHQHAPADGAVLVRASDAGENDAGMIMSGRVDRLR